MGFVWSEMGKKSNGGTELMARQIESRIGPELLDNFQIFCSRITEEPDQTKVRLFYLHDCAGDPSMDILKNDGWRKFHRIICVSNHQMQEVIKTYGVPWDRCMVIRNAIEPIPAHTKPAEGPIRIIYTSTPQRGLDILGAAFEHLAQKHEDIELEIYSSFNLYGWENADKQFDGLFEKLDKLPRVSRHGAVPNEQIREALTKSHIWVLPGTWAETSCLCLMEAMSAGCVCVHSNYGALYETAGPLTMMYQFQQDKNLHASVFSSVLEQAIGNWRDHRETLRERLTSQSLYASIFFSWAQREQEWKALLGSLKDLPREFDKDRFVYRVV